MDDALKDQLNRIEALLEQLVANTRPLTPGEILDQQNAMMAENRRRYAEWRRLHPPKPVDDDPLIRTARELSAERKKAKNHPVDPPEKTQ